MGTLNLCLKVPEEMQSTKNHLRPLILKLFQIRKNRIIIWFNWKRIWTPFLKSNIKFPKIIFMSNSKQWEASSRWGCLPTMLKKNLLSKLQLTISYSLVTKMLDGWYIFRLKGGIHRLVRSSKTLAYKNRYHIPRFWNIDIRYYYNICRIVQIFNLLKPFLYKIK